MSYYVVCDGIESDGQRCGTAVHAERTLRSLAGWRFHLPHDIATVHGDRHWCPNHREQDIRLATTDPQREETLFT